MREEEEKFSALLAFSSERLQDLGVSPDKLKVYLTQLSVSQTENIPQFSEHMAGIMLNVDSHSKIFTFLSRVGAWGFLNFYLLKCVARRYGDDEMKGEVEKYGTEVDTLKSETKLKDYLRACSNRSPYGSLPERKPLIVKLEEEWGDCTLADVAEQEGYLAGEFLLEQYIFHFSNAAKGCVTLTWLIPTTAIPLIRRAITENRVKLKGTICELIVGDECFIFKVTYEILSTQLYTNYSLFLNRYVHPTCLNCLRSEYLNNKQVCMSLPMLLGLHIDSLVSLVYM